MIAINEWYKKKAEKNWKISIIDVDTSKMCVLNYTLIIS